MFRLPALLLVPAFFALLLPACRPGQDYAKYIRELDSLKVVTEQAVDHFRTVDSAACYEAWTRQQSYRLLLEAELHDTVPRAVAESLSRFFSGEQPMKDYLAMRPVWLSEARAEIRQIGLLSNDLKNGSVGPAEAVEFIGNEKRRSEKIIGELKTNTQLIRRHLELYAKHLPVVEQVVREHHSGTLPNTGQQTSSINS